jgi:molybdenum cofactor biosynthesis enzyme MoaA
VRFPSEPSVEPVSGNQHRADRLVERVNESPILPFVAGQMERGAHADVIEFRRPGRGRNQQQRAHISADRVCSSLSTVLRHVQAVDSADAPREIVRRLDRHPFEAGVIQRPNDRPQLNPFTVL